MTSKAKPEDDSVVNIWAVLQAASKSKKRDVAEDGDETIIVLVGGKQSGKSTITSAFIDKC